MMQTYQDKVLDEFERIANKAELTVAVSYNASNTGLLVAQDGFATIARLEFHFQTGHNRVQFDGAPLGPGADSALWAEHEDAKVAVMFDEWRTRVARVRGENGERS